MSTTVEVETGHTRSLGGLWAGWAKSLGLSSAPASASASPKPWPMAPAIDPAVLRRRKLITLSVMAATIMHALDGTIANVALPSIQGSLSATQEQVSWVVTSYIVASAILTPLAGFCAMRFGLRRTLATCVICFTIVSMMCGAAQSLEQLVLFRALQGGFGAALVPVSQAIMMDTYPREEQGKAMAMWGVGTMVGPIAGPSLGGWLTDEFTWRWVFYVNLPVGILCAIGILALVRDNVQGTPRRFDLLGFTLLAVAIGSFQLMLDRGHLLDWFDSVEIIGETLVAGVAFAMFLIHMMTDRQPFLSRAAVPRPQPEGRPLLHRPGRPGADRDGDPDAAVPAAAHGLSGVHHRHRAGAARRGHDGVDDAGCTPDRPRGCAHADRPGLRAGCPLALRHDAVQPQCQRGAHRLERRAAGLWARPRLPAAHRAHLRHPAGAPAHRGAAVNALLRNLGASIGIAVLVSMLASNTHAEPRRHGRAVHALSIPAGR